MSITLGGIASAIGGAGALASLFGGGSGGTAPKAIIPPYEGNVGNSMFQNYMNMQTDPYGFAAYYNAPGYQNMMVQPPYGQPSQSSNPSISGAIGGGGMGSNGPGGYGQSSGQGGMNGPTVGQLTNAQATTPPATFPGYANQVFQSGFNNPYAQGMVGSAGQAGNIYGQSVNPLLYNAGMIQGAVPQQLGAAGSAFQAGLNTYNTSLDPQQTLYNQLLQQTQDQTNAGEAARGLATTGVGQGIANQNLNNFNIDWQNQQLARQLQGNQALNAGANALNAGVAGAGTTAQGVGNLFSQAAGAQGQVGALPYNAQNTMAGNQNTALSQQTQQLQNYMYPQQQNFNNALAYMGLGQAGQAGLNSANNAYNKLQYQNQQGIGQALGGFASSPIASTSLGALFGGAPIGTDTSTWNWLNNPSASLPELS
jgi:hypothetical protein